MISLFQNGASTPDVGTMAATVSVCNIVIKQNHGIVNHCYNHTLLLQCNHIEVSREQMQQNSRQS
jgi:hypothetical protein